MEVLNRFLYGTIVCNGCAKRIDSEYDDEFLHNVDELEDHLRDNGWEEKDGKFLCPECVKSPSHRRYPGEGRTIVEKSTTSALKCDLCGREFRDIEGFACWEDFDDTLEHARDLDWQEIGGKMLCPDCYCDCDAIKDEKEEHWEEVYCAKCPYKEDCDQNVPRDKPAPSDECKYAVRTADRNWHKCLWLKESIPGGVRCELPEGKKCSRVEQFEKDRPVIEAKNAEIRKWEKKK